MHKAKRRHSCNFADSLHPIAKLVHEDIVVDVAAAVFGSAMFCSVPTNGHQSEVGATNAVEMMLFHQNRCRP